MSQCSINRPLMKCLLPISPPTPRGGHGSVVILFAMDNRIRYLDQLGWNSVSDNASLIETGVGPAGNHNSRHRPLYNVDLDLDRVL